MQVQIRALLLAGCLSLLAGCNIDKPFLLEPDVYAAPPQVFLPPPNGAAAMSRAGLFLLEAPESVPDVSFPLTQILYQSLLQNRVFQQIEVIPQGYPSPDAALLLARQRRFDFILYGQVPYFLDSGTSSKSALQLDLYLIDVKSGQKQAYVSDAIGAHPSPMLDMIMWDAKPKPSPSVYALARIVAERLALVLAGKPVPDLPDPNKSRYQSAFGRLFNPGG